jgi:diguanylate cyclase (GGDEF)-like protein/PAS domain S-box-containing protein
VADVDPDLPNRVGMLKAYRILDTPAEPEFDRLTRLLACVCGTPVAALMFFDGRRQWFKSEVGLSLRETVDSSPFLRTIREKSLVVVPDAGAARPGAGGRILAEVPSLRFYAGVPVVAPGGLVIGVLAVMDRAVRTLSDAQCEALATLGLQVEVLLELRRSPHARDNGSQPGLIPDVVIHPALGPGPPQPGMAYLAAIIDSSEDAIINKTLQGIITSWNRSAERIFGYSADEMIGNPLLTLIPPERAREESEILARIGHGERQDQVGAVRLRKDGCRIDVLTTMYPVRDGSGRIIGATSIVRDITEWRKSDSQLKLLETCVARLNDIVLITEAEPVTAPGPRIVFVNDAFERRTGYRREEVLGKTPRLLQGQHTQRVELDRIGAALRKGEPVRAELINYTKSGTEFWVELDIVPVADASGRCTHWVAVERDITARKAAEQEIHDLAFYDSLTRLPNRRLLLSRMEQALHRAGHHQQEGAMLFIDLDNFKTLNDSLGHDKGDLLLQQVAMRLAACLRGGDTLGRLGGDEFVVMIERLGKSRHSAMDRVNAVCEKIFSALNQPFQLEGHEYTTTASIGITLFNDEQQNVGELLKRADLAMYQAKAAGRNTLRYFNPDMQAAVTARSILEADLRRGLQQREFLVYYQPQVDGDSKVIGAEALVRWQHPTRGIVAPADFIALAEETGLIVRLGEWVLETACRQLAEWAERAETVHLEMAVNVSARQFRHPDFVEQVLTVLDLTGANALQLKLELTESVLVDDMDVTIAKMTELKAKGVGFSLDDFGTGYSSLFYLKRLPLDQLKIDRSFVRDVLTDANDAAIARTVVALGQSLGLDVIAEGVETEAQRAFLVSHNCDTYQGFLFSQAVSADQFELLLRRNEQGQPAHVPAELGDS